MDNNVFDQHYILLKYFLWLIILNKYIWIKYSAKIRKHHFGYSPASISGPLQQEKL